MAVVGLGLTLSPELRAVNFGREARKSSDERTTSAIFARVPQNLHFDYSLPPLELVCGEGVGLTDAPLWSSQAQESGML